MELKQTQSQQLNQQQLQGVRLLQMGSMELEQYLRELAQDNPMVDLEPESAVRGEDSALLHQLRWLEDNDRQNLYYQQMSDEELDPLPRLEQTLEILRGLEPAGVGAESLAQCLELQLLRQSQDPQVRSYLREKLQQAEGVLWAVDQRESTVLRCAQAIADAQAGFFRSGPQALVPLRMADVAQALELHESTVSRAVREKYLQCAQGVYPMSYFFSRRAAAAPEGARMGAAAARLLLRQLIGGEDRSSPHSDRKLALLLAQNGCPVSRRTVAKYRGELNIPDQAGRRRHENQ